MNKIFYLPFIVRRTFSTKNPFEEAIRTKIQSGIRTSHLEINCQSENNVQVVVVSEEFKNMSLLKRHQLVNNLVKEEFNKGLHALSIIAETPEQWNKRL